MVTKGLIQRCNQNKNMEKIPTEKIIDDFQEAKTLGPSNM
jgi:hypothetical protein